jgi:hypothetical protein
MDVCLKENYYYLHKRYWKPKDGDMIDMEKMVVIVQSITYTHL